jgi:16S rRNA (adenine1518-N6/adenine1519-N6)-dimethyltransferase
LQLVRRDTQLFPDADMRQLFRVVKAGFAQRRKTLLNSLSGGLQLSREQTTDLLAQTKIAPNTRAQALSLEQWYDLYKTFVQL